MATVTIRIQALYGNKWFDVVKCVTPTNGRFLDVSQQIFGDYGIEFLSDGEWGSPLKWWDSYFGTTCVSASQNKMSCPIGLWRGINKISKQDRDVLMDNLSSEWRLYFSPSQFDDLMRRLRSDVVNAQYARFRPIKTWCSCARSMLPLDRAIVLSLNEHEIAPATVRIKQQQEKLLEAYKQCLANTLHTLPNEVVHIIAEYVGPPPRAADVRVTMEDSGHEIAIMWGVRRIFRLFILICCVCGAPIVLALAIAALCVVVALAFAALAMVLTTLLLAVVGLVTSLVVYALDLLLTYVRVIGARGYVQCKLLAQRSHDALYSLASRSKLASFLCDMIHYLQKIGLNPIYAL